MASGPAARKVAAVAFPFLAIAGVVLSATAFPIRLRYRELVSHRFDLLLLEQQAKLTYQQAVSTQNSDRFRRLQLARTTFAYLPDAAMQSASAVVVVAISAVVVGRASAAALGCIFATWVPMTWFAWRRSAMEADAEVSATSPERHLSALVNGFLHICEAYGPNRPMQLTFVEATTTNVVRRLRKTRTRAWRRLDAVDALTVIVQAAGTIAALYLVIGGGASAETRATGVLLVMRMRSDVSTLVNCVQWFSKAAEAARSAADFARTLPELPSQRDRGPLANGVRIALRDVRYTYSGSAAPALQEVTLCLHDGERVVILGDNGSGKSTLVDLLLGLREPTNGHADLALEASAIGEQRFLQPQLRLSDAIEDEPAKR